MCEFSIALSGEKDGQVPRGFKNLTDNSQRSLFVNSPTDPCRGLATRFHGKLHVPRKLKCISGQIVFSDSPVSSKGYSTRKLLGYSHVLFCTEPETTLYSFSPKVELLSQIGA